MNISKSQEDVFYRYKLPKLLTKIEGRGNGIKTVVVNMIEIARALKVHPAYSTKFFGFELGAQSRFEGDPPRAIVNGAHTAVTMQNLLSKFIDIFVLCPRCKLPEIKLSVEGEKIVIDCAACGVNSVLKTAHKLATFIIKYPPYVLDKDKKEKKKDKEGDDVAQAMADHNINDTSGAGMGIVSPQKIGSIGLEDELDAAEEAPEVGAKVKKEKKAKKEKKEKKKDSSESDSEEKDKPAKKKKAGRKEKEATEESPEEEKKEKKKKKSVKSDDSEKEVKKKKKEKDENAEESSSIKKEKKKKEKDENADESSEKKKKKKEKPENADELSEKKEKKKKEKVEEANGTEETKVKKKKKDEDSEKTKKKKKDKDEVEEEDDDASSAADPEDVPTPSMDAVKLLQQCISEARVANKKLLPEELAAELRRLCIARALSDEDKAKVLFRVLFAEAATKRSTIPQVVAAISPNLKLFIVQTDKAQAASSMSPSAVAGAGVRLLFSVLEELVVSVYPKLLPYVPHILSQLYDSEVIDEDAVMAWIDSPPQAARFISAEDSSRIKSTAQPFVVWLRSEDEDES